MHANEILTSLDAICACLYSSPYLSLLCPPPSSIFRHPSAHLPSPTSLHPIVLHVVFTSLCVSDYFTSTRFMPPPHPHHRIPGGFVPSSLSLKECVLSMLSATSIDAWVAITSSDNERMNSSYHCLMHSLLAPATAAACVYNAFRMRCTTAASLEARDAIAATQSRHNDHMDLRACTVHTHQQTYIHRYMRVYTHRIGTLSVYIYKSVLNSS